MEDNNNNAKKAGDKIKKAGKDAAKKAGIEIAKKILPTILPYIGIFILILLAAGVINLIPYLVRNVFSSLLGLGTTQEATQENVTVLDEAQSIVEINEYGGYDVCLNVYY